MTSTLGLYRQLLRVSAVWPSSNRGKIMQEIRAGAPPSYQPLMHSPEPAACTRAPCTLVHSLENTKHTRSKQRRSFAPLPRRVSTEPERDRRRQAAEDAERSQHSGHVETRRLEALAIRPCSTPRQRQATLRAPSALGLPRSASVSLGCRCAGGPDICVCTSYGRHWAADDADSGRLEGLERDWQHEWGIGGSQASCRRMIAFRPCMCLLSCVWGPCGCGVHD